MAILSASQIRGGTAPKTELVSVPEWAGEIAVRAITAAERDDYEASLLLMHDDGSREFRRANMRARLCALAIVDAQGSRLFSDADAEMLGGKPAAIIDRIFAVAQRLAGIGPGDAETLEKNSGSGPAGEQSSASPSPSAAP